MAHHIIVWDPKGEYWEGSLVDDQKASILGHRGVTSLPVDAAFLTRAGVAGYHKRAWGAGWPLDFISPRMVCPLTMYCLSTMHNLHWAIRLVPDSPHVPAAKAGKPFTTGQLRLAGDGNGTHGHHTTVKSEQPTIEAARLPALDEHTGWTIEGVSQVNPSVDGFYGFGLYGTLPGIRVAWAAISLTR